MFNKYKKSIDILFTIGLIILLIILSAKYYKEKKKNELNNACNLFLRQLNGINLSSEPYFIEILNCDKKEIEVGINFKNYHEKLKLNKEDIYNKIIIAYNASPLFGGELKLKKIILFNYSSNGNGLKSSATSFDYKEIKQ